MFWNTLPQGFTVLAPMEDVTDTVFRQIVASVARPDVFFTEFTNVDAVAYAIRNPGNDTALQRLVFSEFERPVVAQIWGVDPEKFRIASKYVASLGFDGIDINLGCPERKVTKMGACGGMIGQNTQVGEIIAATKEGAGDLPVSVKTRIGNKKIITEEWIGFLLTQNLAALTVHGRTVAEQSLVPAHWDEIGKAVKMRDEINKKTLVIGNGDVTSIPDSKFKIQEYGVDGVMIGRGIFQNPWVFDENYESRIMNSGERISLLKMHLDLWGRTWGVRKNFAVMKKFVKMYVRDFEGATDLRARLMECKTVCEMTNMLH